MVLPGNGEIMALSCVFRRRSARTTSECSWWTGTGCLRAEPTPSPPSAPTERYGFSFCCVCVPWNSSAHSQLGSESWQKQPPAGWWVATVGWFCQGKYGDYHIESAVLPPRASAGFVKTDFYFKAFFKKKKKKTGERLRRQGFLNQSHHF